MTPDTRFASALSEHPVASHAVGEVAGQILEAFDGADPDLVVCFASPHFVGTMDDLAFALGNLLGSRVLLGATAVSIIGGAREVEEGPALSAFAASFPGARLTPVALGVERTPDGATITGWPELDHEPSTLLLLADPFSFPIDGFLHQLDGAHAAVGAGGDLQVIGGAASAARGPGGNRLVLDTAVTSSGAVGVFVDGVDVRTVVSQGCRPVGSPFVITRGERNRVEELGGRAALDRLQECAAQATEEDRTLMRAGLHLGVVVDEHKVEFARGDFLVRNVLGADQESGTLVIGDEIVVGQTVQFHVARRRRGRRGPPGDAERRGGGRGVGVHLQRAWSAPLRCARPRRGRGRPAPRAVAGRRRVLRRGDRAGRRPQLPARVHRQHRVVLSVGSHAAHEGALEWGHDEHPVPRPRGGRGRPRRRATRRLWRRRRQRRRLGGEGSDRRACLHDGDDAVGRRMPAKPELDVAYESIPGVDPGQLSLDVFPPRHGCPAPVVIWVHGGGWRTGDKRNQLADKIRLFDDAGYVLVSVNYRLTDPSSRAPVRYPSYDEDVATAVAWVHDHIARSGGDPGRIALMGHSAGAQIVAGVATDERYLGAHGLGLDALRCVASLDTQGYDVATVAATGNPLYRAAFGDDPATWADASPLQHVAPGKDIPPFLVVERGSAARRRAAETFAQRLRDAEVAVTVVDARPLTHGAVNSQIGVSGDTVITPPLSRFLTGCLRPTS